MQRLSDRSRAKAVNAMIDAARVALPFVDDEEAAETLRYAIRDVNTQAGKYKYLTPAEMGWTVVPWHDWGDHRLLKCECGENHVWPEPHRPTPCVCGKTYWALTLAETRINERQDGEWGRGTT